MRSLEINKRTFWYALYLGSKPLCDSDGNYTGERSILRTEPRKYRANVSPPVTTNISRSVSTSKPGDYGNVIDYDKVIVTSDMSCPIDEGAVLWIDNAPGDGVPYDYVVRRVLKTLNSIAIHITKVRDEITL